MRCELFSRRRKHANRTHRQAHFKRLSFEVLERRHLLTVVLNPVVAASIYDGQDDGIGDAIDNRFTDLIQENSTQEHRAVAEFNLQGLTEPVTLAVLDVQIGGVFAGSVVRTFNLFAYQGNGQADVSDFQLSGTLVRTVSYFGAQGSSTFRLDVTAEVQQLIAAEQEDHFFGLRVDPAGDVAQSFLVSPKLSINGLPAPSGQRAWETVPNAIRANGIETFRVEVDLHGEVQDVTLTPWLTRFVGAGTGPSPLHDDGLNGDRVAGDFIYTSAELRFNTAEPPPDAFFQNSPDSPPGVAIEDVGTINVTELDGSVTEFLIRPQVGLLRPDLPNVATRSQGDLLMSDHLINLRSTAQATQRTLRGNSIDLYQVTKPILGPGGLPDQFDFFTFFSTQHIENAPRLSGPNFNAGMHHTTKVDYTGGGRVPFDDSLSYGSHGKLLGMNVLDAMDRGIWDSNATHELVHQWSAYLPTTLGISDGGAHYRHNTSVGSLVGGQAWIDNGDGSYTIDYEEGRNGATHASPLDLYLMGLIGPAEVPPIRIFDLTAQPPINLFNPHVPADEIVRTVTIDEIMAAAGPRNPPSAAQRDFRIGFVAESHNRFLTPTEMTFYEIFAANYTKTIPPDEPDPHLDFGWAPISRFFGHGSTWTTLLPGQTETLNQAPVAQGAAWEVPESAGSGTVVGTVSASDADAGQSLVFAISEGNDDNTFLINSQTGAIRVNRPLDDETVAEYQLTVVVADTGIPSQFDSAIITIRVTPANSYPPVVTPSQQFSIAENPASGGTVGNVQATDADPGTVLRDFTIVGGNADGAFAIDLATGRISIADPAKVDYEAAHSRTLQVRVSDGTHLSATENILITLTDENDNPPAIRAGQRFAVDESAASGTVLGTVIASDPDTVGDIQGFAIVTGNNDGAFAINSATGQITVADGSQLDYETATSRTLSVRVSDGVHNSALEAVLVEIGDLNEAPTISGATFTLAENSAAGTAVGTVAASDQDAGQQLTFRIASGNDGNAFAINALTGLIRVNNAATLDYETHPVFSLVVEVSDNGTPLLTSAATVTINLTDVLELVMDIKPGDSTNTINLRNESKVAVAILSSSTFNATTQVNIGSLTFGRTGGENSLVRNKKTGLPQYELRDVNGDGRLDLVAYFDTSLTGLRVGDTQATLKGKLTSGVSFHLTGLVKIISRR